MIVPPTPPTHCDCGVSATIACTFHKLHSLIHTYYWYIKISCSFITLVTGEKSTTKISPNACYTVNSDRKRERERDRWGKRDRCKEDRKTEKQRDRRRKREKRSWKGERNREGKREKEREKATSSTILWSQCTDVIKLFLRRIYQGILKLKWQSITQSTSPPHLLTPTVPGIHVPIPLPCKTTKLKIRKLFSQSLFQLNTKHIAEENCCNSDSEETRNCHPCG